MTEEYRVDVPENFVKPDENNLPPVVGVSMVTIEETIVNVPARDRNPGFATGLWSIILSLFPLLFIIGLPLSIASVSKSRKASRSSAIGVVGFIFNILALLSVAFIVIVFFGVIEGFETLCTSVVDNSEIILPNGEQLICPV